MRYDYLFVLYYLTVLGYTKTTPHISISALWWISKKWYSLPIKYDVFFIPFLYEIWAHIRHPTWYHGVSKYMYSEFAQFER